MRSFHFLLFALLLLTTWPAEAKRDLVARRERPRKERAEKPQRGLNPQEQKMLQEGITPPKFLNGGVSRFATWVKQKLVYPNGLISYREDIQLVVEFVVEQDGSMSILNITGSLHPEAIAEARRVFGLAPRWTPCQDANGELLRVRYGIPVIFRNPYIHFINHNSERRSDSGLTIPRF